VLVLSGQEPETTAGIAGWERAPMLQPFTPNR
jgi:hypothetical protein